MTNGCRQINIKVDAKLKKEVTKIFADMGLDLTSGIKIYLKRVQQEKKIPFELTSLAASKQDQAPSNLNQLFSALAGGSQEQNGIGGNLLKATNHHSTNSNGIGENIPNENK